MRKARMATIPTPIQHSTRDRNLGCLNLKKVGILIAKEKKLPN